MSAAATPVRSALLALAAVNAQGAAAGMAFRDSHVDRAYRRRVVAARPRLAKLSSGPGLPAGAASALDALLAAEAKAFAQVAAAAKALARARGAIRARKLPQARRQVLAAAGFSSAAARTLRGVPALRSRAVAALTAAGVTEVTVAGTDVAALQAEVAATGVPADLAALLRGLGVSGPDLRRVRQAFAVPSAGGPALIGPLADPQRTANLRGLSRELSRYARNARRRPIRRSRGGPLRIRRRG